MKATRTIRYEGSPKQLAVLVGMLQAKRVKVEWTPPPELATRQGLVGPTAPIVPDVAWSTDVQQVAATLAAAGALASINKAVAKFRKKFPRARVAVEIDADQGKQDGEQAQSTQG